MVVVNPNNVTLQAEAVFKQTQRNIWTACSNMTLSRAHTQEMITAIITTFPYFVEKEEALFNTDCRLKLLLNCIKKQCKCELQGEKMECDIVPKARLSLLPPLRFYPYHKKLNQSRRRSCQSATKSIALWPAHCSLVAWNMFSLDCR